MNESQPISATDDFFQGALDLVIIIRSEYLNDARHWPCFPQTSVRTTNTGDAQISGFHFDVSKILRIYNGTTHEIRVIFAQYELPRILIYGIADVQVAEKGCTQKTWDIGIVHSVHYQR